MKIKIPPGAESITIGMCEGTLVISFQFSEKVMGDYFLQKIDETKKETANIVSFSDMVIQEARALGFVAGVKVQTPFEIRWMKTGKLKVYSDGSILANERNPFWIKTNAQWCAKVIN